MNATQIKLLKELVSARSFTVGETKRPAVICGAARYYAAALQLAKLGLVDIVKNNSGYNVHYAILPRDRDIFICHDFTLVTQTILQELNAA